MQLQVKNQKNLAIHVNGTNLSFAGVREYERTKHVHRLHPYLGKFIPQLVEVFLKEYFTKRDYILDPFMGSGTTLIEANILGMDRKSTRLNSSHSQISYAAFCFKKTYIYIERTGTHFQMELYSHYETAFKIL